MGDNIAANVLPFRKKRDPLAFADGVPAFDRSNPAHIRLWNGIVGVALASKSGNPLFRPLAGD